MLLDLARALKESARPARAADAYARALRLAPAHPRAHFKLATVLRQLGRRDAAARHLREHLRLEPGHAAARFWLAALGGGEAEGEEGAAAACPPEMVAGLFDQYAEKFDEHLVGALGYRTPRLLRWVGQTGGRRLGRVTSLCDSRPLSIPWIDNATAIKHRQPGSSWPRRPRGCRTRSKPPGAPRPTSAAAPG